MGGGPAADIVITLILIGTSELEGGPAADRPPGGGLRDWGVGRLVLQRALRASRLGRSRPGATRM